MDKSLAEEMAADAEAEAPTPEDKLERVRDAVRRKAALEKDLAEQENAVETTKRRINKMSFEELPDLFKEVGVDKLGVSYDGANFDAALRPFYRASISAKWSEKKQADAYAWLEKNGHGDLIKTIITIELGRGDPEIAKKLEAYLDKHEIAFSGRLGVSWNTLTAFVKEQTEKGVVLPLEVLGATVGDIVTLKPRKE